jgi:hypothetical protein
MGRDGRPGGRERRGGGSAPGGAGAAGALRRAEAAALCQRTVTQAVRAAWGQLAQAPPPARQAAFGAWRAAEAWYGPVEQLFTEMCARAPAPAAVAASLSRAAEAAA